MNGSRKNLPFRRACPPSGCSHRKDAPPTSIHNPRCGIVANNYVIALNGSGQALKLYGSHVPADG